MERPIHRHCTTLETTLKAAIDTNQLHLRLLNGKNRKAVIRQYNELHLPLLVF